MKKCSKKEGLVKGFSSMLLAFLIILFASIFAKEEAYAEVKGLNADSFSGLIISEDVYNEPRDLTYTISGGSPNLVRVYRVTREQSDWAEGRYQRFTYDYDRHIVSPYYLPKSGKINFEFVEGMTPQQINQYTIKVKYPKIGYMENDQLERREVGAFLTMKNITRPPNQYSDFYGEKISSIDLASNLYSGINYVGVNSVDLTFEFFYTDTDEIIDFKSNEDGYGESAMSFNSLNGHSNSGPSNGANPEFAKEINNRDGVVARETIIERGDRTMKFDYSPETLQFNNIYYGTSNAFDDYLGSKDFHKASVQFPLIGKENTFQAGTTYSNNTVWFSMSSAKIDAPYNHRVPIKTVQPLKQYKQGDDVLNPTGNESGFEQRYWNDLDVYSDNQNDYEIPNYYRVKGHEPDKPSELAPGVPKREDRYIEKDEEFYYYINQKTINIGSDGLILPTGYGISDTLPEGIVLTDHPFTLYNLDGRTINLEEIGIPNYNNKDSFSLKLNNNQVNQINKLATQHDYYGEDFSLRVKVRATEKVKENELQVNQASTSFTYFDSSDPGDTVIQYSNHVATKIEEKKGPIEFRKTDQFGKEVRKAEFKIYRYEESNNNKKGELLATATSDDKGQVKFDKEFGPGKYVLEESKAPEGFRKREDIVIEMDDELKVKWPDNMDGVVENVKGYNLTLWKYDENREKLTGAEFELTGGDLTAPLKSSPYFTTIGQIRFEGGHISPGQTYTLKETKAPDRYELLKDIYKVEINKDGTKSWLISPDGTKEELNINKNVPENYHYEIGQKDTTGYQDIGIVNEHIKGPIEFKKTDQFGKAVGKAEFKIYRCEESNNNKKGELLATATSDDKGQVKFDKKFGPGKYVLEESKAPEGFRKREDIVIEMDDDLKVKWPDNMDGVVENIKGYNLTLWKFDENRKKLPGAEFELTGGDLTAPLKNSSNFAKNGQIRFEGGHLSQGETYLLNETVAPIGYQLSKDTYEIEISKDGKSAWLINPKGEKEALNVNINIEKEGYHNEIGRNNDDNYQNIGIVNKPIETNLEIIKQDKDSKIGIKDVEFKVFTEKEDPEEASIYKSDTDGKLEVPNLKVTETYHIREVKVSDDYIKLETDIIMAYDIEADDWVVYDEDSNQPHNKVEWNKKTRLLKIYVYNEQKKILPATGGIGRLIPVVLSTIAGLSTVYYFVNRHREGV